MLLECVSVANLCNVEDLTPTPLLSLQCKASLAMATEIKSIIIYRSCFLVT